MNLAQAVQEASAKVGDVIEIVSRADWLTKAISKEFDGPSPTMEGKLIEITAIGDQGILGYTLSGIAKNKANNKLNYDAYIWSHDAQEMWYRGGSTIRKVGWAMSFNKYDWTLPHLDNVYSRCQK